MWWYFIVIIFSHQPPDDSGKGKFSLCYKLRYTWKLRAILSGLTLLGMTAMPRCTVCLSSTWAGVLPIFSAISTTTGLLIKSGSSLLQNKSSVGIVLFVCFINNLRYETETIHLVILKESWSEQVEENDNILQHFKLHIQVLI